MSEVYTILQALDTILQADTNLSDVKSFTIFEDEMWLAETNRQFPFINLNSELKKTKEAENMPTKSFERRTYEIIITFAVCKNTKSEVKQTLWDLLEDIEYAYKNDRTIGGTVKATSEQSEIAVDALKYPEDNTWIGRGIMIYEVVKDEYIGG